MEIVNMRKPVSLAKARTLNVRNRSQNRLAKAEGFPINGADPTVDYTHAGRPLGIPGTAHHTLVA